ncbi:MAG TPA: alpha/beta fold hydrolase [Acidimicrobiales bacterium]
MALPRVDVEFTSQDTTLRGWLYRAVGPGPHPGVVMAHGLSAVKEMFLDRYAEAFADAGFTTLAYDHPGFGASDGEPRQCPAPSLQLQGYRDAVAWLAADPGVDADRIGLWGSSFSGGEVIILASEDLPVRCGVAQVPGLGEGGPDLPAGALSVFTRAFETGDEEATIAAVTASPDGAGLMFEDGAYGWFTRVAAERAPAWKDELRISAFGEAFRPIDHLADARVPLLLVVAPGDTLTPPGAALPIAASTPNVSVIEIPGGHFDAYESGFAASAGPAVDWFRRYLAG